MIEDPQNDPGAQGASFGFRTVAPEEKPGLVRGVFARVAPRYDLMNDAMSGGVHRLWKDMTAARLNPQPGDLIIDCAGGTGDMARRLARLAEGARRRRGGQSARILVIDYNEAMLAVGRRRGDDADLSWAVGDAQSLPLPDACANGYVIAFGIRNVTSIEAALSEARRVLKPGGRFVCLEFSRPPAAAVRALYDAYSFNVIPKLGALVSRDEASYRYLVESIRRFPDQERFSRLIQDAGFRRVGHTNLTGGVAALHQGFAD
jgi:demethylmenaquinone methyltransferase/2-methoxy-6-polyprenyl-1,4-benzoquinol methylase